MLGKLRDLSFNRDGTINVTVTVDSEFSRTYDALKGKPVDVQIKKASKSRSLEANSFLWALCSDIGRAMTPPLAKEDVYRIAIKAVGVYTPVEVVTWDVETIKRRWSSHGTGWFAEVADEGRTGRKWLHLYYGTSTYTVDEMRVLLDWLIDEAQQMEISIPMSKAQEEELLERWGKNVTGNGSH